MRHGESEKAPLPALVEGSHVAFGALQAPEQSDLREAA